MRFENIGMYQSIFISGKQVKISVLSETFIPIFRTQKYSIVLNVEEHGCVNNCGHTCKPNKLFGVMSGCFLYFCLVWRRTRVHTCVGCLTGEEVLTKKSVGSNEDEEIGKDDDGMDTL